MISCGISEAKETAVVLVSEGKGCFTFEVSEFIGRVGCGQLDEC